MGHFIPLVGGCYDIKINNPQGHKIYLCASFGCSASDCIEKVRVQTDRNI